MTAYIRLLRDPRWQRRRLEILERANFKCEQCGAHEKTLHVHHKIYRKGAMPWEYTDEELISLCEDCHEIETGLRAELARCLASGIPLERMIGYAYGLMMLGEGGESISTNLGPGDDKPKGLSDAFSPTTPKDLYEVADEGGNVCGEQLHDLFHRRLGL